MKILSLLLVVLTLGLVGHAAQNPVQLTLRNRTDLGAWQVVPGQTNLIAHVLGTSAVADGGEEVFYFAPGDTTTPSSTVIASTGVAGRWLLNMTPPQNAAKFNLPMYVNTLAELRALTNTLPVILAGSGSGEIYRSFTDGGVAAQTQTATVPVVAGTTTTAYIPIPSSIPGAAIPWKLELPAMVGHTNWLAAYTFTIQASNSPVATVRTFQLYGVPTNGSGAVTLYGSLARKFASQHVRLQIIIPSLTDSDVPSGSYTFTVGYDNGGTYIRSTTDLTKVWVKSLTTGTFNVLDFGAIPNDGVDDAAAINAAIAMADGAGGVVEFPDGTFNTASTITLDQPGVTLRGAGWGWQDSTGNDVRGTVISHSGSGYGIVVGYDSNLVPISTTIEKLAVVGTSSGMGGIRIGATSLDHNVSNVRVTVRDVCVSGYTSQTCVHPSAVYDSSGSTDINSVPDTGAAGIFISRGSAMTFFNVTARHNYRGLYECSQSPATTSDFTSCDISNNYRCNVRLTGALNFTFKNCNFEYVYGPALLFEQTSTSTNSASYRTPKNNVFDACYVEQAHASVPVASAERISGVIHAGTSVNHYLKTGDTVVLNMTDDTYDTTNTVTVVDNTNFTIVQAGIDDADGGTGTVARTGYDIEMKGWSGTLEGTARTFWPAQTMFRNTTLGAGGIFLSNVTDTVFDGYVQDTVTMPIFTTNTLRTEIINRTGENYMNNSYYSLDPDTRLVQKGTYQWETRRENWNRGLTFYAGARSQIVPSQLVTGPSWRYLENLGVTPDFYQNVDTNGNFYFDSTNWTSIAYLFRIGGTEKFRISNTLNRFGGSAGPTIDNGKVMAFPFATSPPSATTNTVSIYGAKDVAGLTQFTSMDTIGTLNELRGIRGSKTLTSGSPISVFSITIQSNVFAGGVVHYTIGSIGSTTNTVASGTLTYSVIAQTSNLATIVNDVQQTPNGLPGPGVLTWTWAPDTGTANVATFKLTATSDMAGAVVSVRFHIIDTSSCLISKL